MALYYATTDVGPLLSLNSLIKRKQKKMDKLRDTHGRSEDRKEEEEEEEETMLYSAEVISARSIQSWKAPRSILRASSEK